MVQAFQRSYQQNSEQLYQLQILSIYAADQSTAQAEGNKDDSRFMIRRNKSFAWSYDKLGVVGHIQNKMQGKEVAREFQMLY